MDKNKFVRIQWAISPEKIRVVIKDEGPGFDPCDVPDPTALENLERPCGRGIMLMKAFMDLIEYSERGTILTIEKNQGSE